MCEEPSKACKLTRNSCTAIVSASNQHALLHEVSQHSQQSQSPQNQAISAKQFVYVTSLLHKLMVHAVDAMKPSNACLHKAFNGFGETNIWH